MAAGNQRRHAAGLFDIRNIIGALLGVYGVVLVLVGLLSTSSADTERAGTDADLWVGIVLLVVGVLFIAWAYARPIVVDEEQVARDKAAVDDAAGRSPGQSNSSP